MVIKPSKTEDPYQSPGGSGAHTFWQMVSPLAFLQDIYSFVIAFSGRIVRVGLLLAVNMVQGSITLKQKGLRQLMVRNHRLYTVSFLSLLLIVIIIVVVGWGINISWLTQVEASEEETEEYLITTNPNDLLVQNASLETLIPQSRPRLEVEIYKVQPGDTVSSIAAKFGVTEDTIKWANNLKDVAFLKVGQDLKIPPGTGILHTVQKGDNLKSVAGKYNGNQQLIADVNWLDPPFDLVVGTELFVPDGVMPEPAKPIVAAATPRYTAPPRNYNPPPSTGRFLSWPVAGGKGYVSQCPSKWHMAVDIADASMPNLLAAAEGKVIFAGYHKVGYAWMVVIDHGNGYSTLYAHMNKLYVSAGQYVGRGQAIGQMGSTGWSTGVHVHFELIKGGVNGTRVNPAPAMYNNICGY